MHKSQRLINHVALVLDGSSSMSNHSRNLVKVADEQIRHLALRSEELSQETRVSVYLFADRVQCLVFDMDVMRLPSIADLYRANGMTALVDSVIKSQQDLATTSQIYGDHAFLTFVLTDGMENASVNRWTSLSRALNSGENWTVGFLVPDQQGVAYMSRIGVSGGNVAVWDAQSAQGLADSFQTIRSATDNFMTARASGVRGSRSVFSTGIEAVNKKTVSKTLTPMSSEAYDLFPVRQKSRMDEFMRATQGKYVQGKGYYQLTKTEKIQPQKRIIIVEKASGQAYSGSEARGLLGLPVGSDVKVKPDDNPEYDVFVQSTAPNRSLLPNTNVLMTN